MSAYLNGVRTIWKFPLEIVDEQTIDVPQGATALLVDVQEGVLTLWVEVDPNAEKIPRRITIEGTGHAIPPGASHLGSAVMPPFVWHVYEFPPSKSIR